MWSLAEPDLPQGQGEVLLLGAEAGRFDGLREALAGAGLDPILPGSRRAGLGHLRHVDLAVVEVDRVDAEGWEICRTIRGRFPDLPLVVVSGPGTEGLASRTLSMGAADHICLPVPAEALAARIRSRIGCGRALRAKVRAGERMHRLVQMAPTPLFVLLDGRIQLGNPPFWELIRHSPEKGGSEPSFAAVLVEEDGDRLTAALVRWEEAKSKLLRLPVRIRQASREPRRMELTLARLGSEEAGALVGTIADPPASLATEDVVPRDSFFRALVQGADDLIMVVDRHGTVRYSSPSVERAIGLPPEELEGQQILSFVHREDADGTRHLLARMAERTGAAVTARCRLRGADGDWRVMEFTARDRLDDGDVRGFVIHARDVSAQQRAEDALRESEARFRLLVEGSRDIFFYVRKPDGELVYVSPAVTGILSRDPGELIGTIPEWLRAACGGPEPDRSADSVSRLAVAATAEGEPVTLELVESAGDSESATGLVQGFARDVSERERLQSALREAAFRDALTGLPNRALFTDRVRHAITRLKRHPDHIFALLFLDLDRFKVINDSLGHTVGDRLLQAVAERLRLHLRPEDTLARFGGDEFAILLEDIAGPADAPRVARRIGEVLGIPFDLNGYEVYTSASIGIVMASPSTGTPESLIQSADMAMYRAKAGGGNAFEMYDQPMHAEAIRRLQLEGHLRRAVERDELCLHFQPLVRIADGAIAGVEALLRWNHPVYGTIPAGEFIGIAEEAGFINEIGQWAMHAACEQIAGWQADFGRADLFISLNFSSRQLRDWGILRQVQSVLVEYGLAPGSLRLEITENALLDPPDRTVRVLRELIQRGVEVFLDDFGTGYTSLGQLLNLPLNGLKLDRSLVGRMCHDPRYAVLVQSTMNIAKGLGLRVIAEGVEDPVQLDVLTTLGCDFGQGFLFGPPVPAREMAGRLTESSQLPTPS